MLLVYGHYKYVDTYGAGIDFSRRNLKTSDSVDPRAVRVKKLKPRLELENLN